MRQILTSFIIVILCLTLYHQLPPKEYKGVLATYKYSHIVGLDYGNCSGTAIAKHAILTATHCVVEHKAPFITIDRGIVVYIDGRMDDGHDHTILLLRGITFENYTSVQQRTSRIGERIFFGGVPVGFDSLMFREGRISSLIKRKEHTGYLIQTILYGGDSGSGLFDADGNLIGMIGFAEGESNGVQSIVFGGGFDIKFTKEQLRQAYGYRYSRQIPYLPF